MSIEARVGRILDSLDQPSERVIPLTLDRTRGHLVMRPGARATIHLDDEGDLPRAHARLALYRALIDGRCKVPADVYVELELDRPEPRVQKPGVDLVVDAYFRAMR